MRKAIIPAFLLVLSGLVLGATVLREPLAEAASPFTNVIVGNDATNPIPVREQNTDANGNIKIHEQGTVPVSVGSPAAPPEPFTMTVRCTGNDDPTTCSANSADTVPPGKRFVVQTMSATGNAFGPARVSDFEVAVKTDGDFTNWPMLATEFQVGPTLTFSAAETRAVTLYVDGGSRISFHVSATSASTIDAELSLSGYLVLAAG